MITRLVRRYARKLGVELSWFKPETAEAARLARILESQGIDLVLDVGANVGQFARQIRETGYRGQIVSFEPLAREHAALLQASRNDPRWEVASRVAVGDREGSVELHRAKNSVSSSVMPMLASHQGYAPDSGYVDAETVALRTLDSLAAKWLEQARAPYLKIDVQGFERSVLEGAPGTLKRVKAVQLELSLVPLYQGAIGYRDMLEQMEGLGFELFALVPGFTDEKTGRLLQMDGIFVR